MQELIINLLKKLPVKWAIGIAVPVAIFGGGYLGGNTAISQQVAVNKAVAEESLQLAQSNEDAIKDLQNTVNNGFENLSNTLQRYQDEGRLETRESIELMYVRELSNFKRELLQEIRSMNP